MTRRDRTQNVTESARPLSLVLACALILAACASDGGTDTTRSGDDTTAPSTTEATEDTGAADGEITLRYQTHTNAGVDEFNEELVAAFEEAHPGVNVEFNAVPFENYEPGLLTSFVGGEGPDLFWIGDWVVPQFYEAGVLADYDPDAYGISREEFIAQYEPQQSLDPYLIDGGLYTAGISEYNVVSLVYNPACFIEAGLGTPSSEEPLSWEEFAEIAGQLTKYEDGERVRQGWSYWTTLDIWTVLVLHPMLEQLGGDLIDDSGQAQFDSPEMREVLSYLADLRFEYDAFDPAFTTDPLSDVANERQCMAFLGPWGVPVIQAQEGADPNLEIAVAPLPNWEGSDRGVSQYSWSWQVNATAPAERQALAWELARYLNGYSPQWFDRAGYIQPKITEETESEPGVTVLDHIREAGPHVEVFENDFDYGVSQFRSENYNEIAAIWTRAVTTVLEGGDVDQALQQAQSEADAIG